MSNLAVLASGNGSNFQAIVERFAAGNHRVCCLLSDKPDAFVLERARRLGIPDFFVSYTGRKRSEAERDVLEILAEHNAELIALAGFMRVLTALVVDAYPGRIVNIHPSILPNYPGMHAIAESFADEDTQPGITIHRVDHGVDTGPIIVQRSLERVAGETLDEFEERIHLLEHQTYPEVIMGLLDELQNSRPDAGQTQRRTQ